MNEQLLKDFLATAKKDNYNWDVILPKFPELKDYDLQLLKDYAATAKKDNYDYSIINPKFPEFNLEEQEGGKPVNFTEGSGEQQEQPTEPLEKPIVDVDRFDVPETDEYLSGAREAAAKKLKETEELLVSADIPDLPKHVIDYPSYNVEQLDSALTDIGKREKQTNFILSTRGLTQPQRTEAKKQIERLEEERAAAIVYKAEKTNDYSLVGDAVQAVKDVGYSSAIGKKLRPEVYKLESRVSEDIFKEIEGVDIYDLTEIDFNGIRRADVDKVADLADKVAESIADGNPGVRQIAYERILNEAEEYERTKKIKEKIESDTETQDIFSKYRNEALSEFESTNDDGIKYRAELVSTVDSINNNAQSRLNKLVLDYNSDVDLYKQELISQVQQGIITNKEANKKLKDYNIQLYSELESSNNLVIENNKKDIEEVSKEYYKKIEGGFNQFLLDNPMDPSDVEKLQASMKKIYEEVDEGEFAYLKAKENLQSLRFGGATSLVASLGKSYYADLGRAVSSKGTFFNQPWMTELGDEMMTSFSVADERVEDWSDLANVPAVVKSVGRLAGSATTSIAVGAITSAATAGLGTIPAMAAVATASGVTESIDMAGGIKRDIIRETGSLLKGEQGAEAMWKAQMGNWWTYLFDGLPYVGKALRGVSSKAAKIGIVGLESSATETVQETRQTAQEQKIMESVRSGEEISARGFGELITPGLVKSTFLEVAPGSFFLGGSTRAVTEFMMDEKADKLAKEIIVKTRAGLVDNTDSFIRQKIFASMNQFGKNFTNSWLATLQKNGAITEEELGKLYTYSKTAEGFLRNVEGLNLTEEQMNTYFALSNRANELYDKAESITDDKVTRATLTEQANALKKNAQDFLNNPETGGSFVSVKIGKSPAIIMNEEQAIEFVTNNPYVVLPESEVDIVARNADEFGGILEQMANGVEAATEAKLKDVETAAQRLANRTKEQKNLFGDQHTDKKLPYGAADISDITTTDKNGVTTATYVNPETNSVDVIITATNKGNFVGYTRVYENGKPTDMFTAKMQASESGKFKNIITSAENALPDNVEVVETSTISTGGLKSYNKSRLVEKVDEDGNVVTRPTKYSDATKESVKEKGEAAYKPFKTTDKSAAEAEIAKIKEAYPGINTKIIEIKVPPIPPQPGKKPGKKAPNQYSISIDLPVLVKPEGMKNLAPVTEVAATTQQASEVAKEAPIVTDDAGKAITVYRGGKPASGVQFYTDDQKLAEDIGKAKDEGVQKATVRMSNPWTPESLDVNNAPQWMKDWVRSREEFTTVDEETMAAEEIPMEQAIQEIKDMRLSFRDVGLWQSFVNETLKHHDGIIAFDPSEDMATDKKIYITRSPEQVVTEDITEDKKEVTNAEKTKIAEGIGKVRKVKPKNIKGLLDVMGGVFGLNKTQSESAAVVGDVLVETMAKRAGVSKEEMYQRIAYQKAQKAPDGSLKQEAPIFKSTAQEGIGKIQQKAATPEQWVKMITDKGGKGTTQELEWIGLQDYLNEWKKENNAKSVPREVVEQYINDNQIEIVEVKSPTNESIGKSDYTGYTLEGGENYREVLLTLPSKKPRIEIFVDKLKKKYNVSSPVELEKVVSESENKEWNRLTEEGDYSKLKENYKSSHWDESNILAHLRINERTLPNGERVMFIEEVQSDWAQEGKKEGFFTENQKENREEYANDALRYGELIKKNNKEREILKNNKELVASVSVMNESGITSWTGIEDFGKENTVFTNGNNIPRVKEDLVDYKDLPKEYRDAYEKRKKITSEYHKTSEEINSLESKYGTVLNDFGDDILKQPDDLLDAGSVPDMPYKKTDQWVGMAMRRAMQMASQEGFDRVAWVTGEQSADRYDLSKQVDAIKYTKEGGKYNIIAENNGVDQITKNNLSESELESAVGKEVAQKIVNGEGDSELNFGFKTLTGQDLKVGGEGMKAFYNSILPKVAKKEAQRFDKKANIEVVDFGDNTSKVVVDVQRDGSIRLINENGGFIAEYNKNQFKEAYKEADRLNERIDSSQVVGKQLSIPITPEMRMNLNSAVPLFQKEQGAMTAADGQYVIYALTDPNVSTPLHELAHVYEHYLTDDEIAVIERWGGHKAGTVEFSEKFARGFEKFLAGGKVKNPRLQKIFENFKKWLTEIYNGIKGSEIDIQLNSEMESIYDNMLGAEEVTEETTVEAPVKETVKKDVNAEVRTLNDNFVEDEKGFFGKKRRPIGDIVSFAKKNNISEEALTIFLKDKKYSEKQIESAISALNQEIDMSAKVVTWLPDFANKALEKAYEQIGDKYYRLLKLQKQTSAKTNRILSEEVDAYLATELETSKIAESINKFKNRIIKSKRKQDPALIERMSKDNISVESLGLYMYAMHATERNEFLKQRAIDEGREGNLEGLSGMTNEQAQEILDSIPENTKEKLEEYASEFRKEVIIKRVDNLKDSGLISDETADRLKNTYKYYVPLKVEEFESTKTATTTPRKIGVKGSVIWKAKGSNFFDAQSRRNPVIESINAYIQDDIKAERNRTFQTLMGLTREINDKNILEIYRPRYQEMTDGLGNKVFIPLHKEPPNQSISGNVDGKVVYIIAKDKDLFKSLNNVPQGNYSTAVKVLQGVNSYLRNVNTLLNPEFIATNFARDIQTALINISAEDARKMSLQMIKNIPNAAKGIFQNEKGVESKWSKIYQELKDNGGDISWLDINSVDKIQKEVVEAEKAYRKNPTQGKVKDLMMIMGEFFTSTIKASEMATRLAAYQAAIENNYPPKKAASLAKNLTVNFEKKGFAGNIINTFYLFANAGLQGAFRIFKALGKKGRGGNRARAIVTGVIATSFLNSMINELNDDEDELELLTDSDRDRKMVWKLPDGGSITIPLPYGYNVFWALGQNMYRYVSEKTNASQFMAATISSVNGAFNPFSSAIDDDAGAALIQSITPTAVKPIVEIGMNKNWNGAPVKPEQFPFGPKKKESELYFSTVRKPSRKVTEFLSELGVAEISPEIIDYTVDFLGGGLGRFITNSGELIYDVATGEDVPEYRIPFYRQFYMKPNDRNIIPFIYEINANREIQDFTEREEKLYKKYLLKAFKDGLIDNSKYNRMRSDFDEAKYKRKAAKKDSFFD